MVHDGWVYKCRVKIPGLKKNAASQLNYYNFHYTIGQHSKWRKFMVWLNNVILQKVVKHLARYKVPLMLWAVRSMLKWKYFPWFAISLGWISFSQSNKKNCEISDSRYNWNSSGINDIGESIATTNIIDSSDSTICDMVNSGDISDRRSRRMNCCDTTSKKCF